MPIEWFTESATRGFQPKVSLRPRGQIGFNQGAVRKFELQKYEYAILGYDKNSNNIAIKPVHDNNQKGAVKLRVKKTGTDATISAKAFFDYYEIKCEKAIRLDAEWNEELEAITAIIPQEECRKDEDEVVI
ncbi:MAG: hypothetical protein ACYC6Z_02340 [Thermoleophilia bacterium]